MKKLAESYVKAEGALIEILTGTTKAELDKLREAQKAWINESCTGLYR